MSKVRKLILTVAALAALAVGGAAFAQAQSSSSDAPAPMHQSSTEVDPPGDSDGAPSAEKNETGGGHEASQVERADGQQEASDGDGEVKDD